MLQPTSNILVPFMQPQFRRGTGGAFSPSDLTGLKLWLKADSLALNDNDPVATWTDSSGLGNNATQVTAGFKPLFKTAILNGKPIVRCDAVDDGMSSAAVANRPYTIFLVASQPSQPGATTSRILAGGSGLNTLIAIRRPNNCVFTGGDVRGLPFGANGVACVVALTVSAVQTTTLHHNGTDIADATPSSANFGTVNLGTGGTYAEAANADVAEVIVYDTALSTTDRQSVETYLRSAARWNF